MEDDELFDGWIESEDIICDKCGKIVELPIKDGPFEYYANKDALHGLVCIECGKTLCDECGNWQTNEEGRTVCFDCFDEERHSRVNINIHNAITFAARKHHGQFRKATDIPYIAHPMEVMQILIENNCEEKVIIAGLLHDTLEDTETTPDEISTNFGSKILKIVQSETEDKSKSWTDRKLAAVEHIRTASIESKLVCCADKLANLRSIYADLKTVGEKVWERFNAEKSQIQKYYENMLAAIADISDIDMYQDLSDLIEDVFTLKWEG